MSLALGDVIAQIGGASVVREHTPLNVTSTQDGAEVWSGTIPAGHVLAVEITTNAPAQGGVGVVPPDQSWGDIHTLAASAPRLTFVTEPGREGPVTVFVLESSDPFTVTGITTTLIPT